MTAVTARSDSYRAATPELPDAATWERWDIDPGWSRLLDVPSHAGGTRQWHVLDTGRPAGVPAGDAVATVLCVHGNPTWAYAWATFLRRLSDRYRVIAVDQLGMGYSERTIPRRYVDRVRDLDDVIVALGLPDDGPLVLAAHDWGGAIAMGWVVQDPRQVAGMILCNTGIGVPEGRQAPAIIRLAAWAPLLDAVCRGTRLFVEGTVRLSGRRISRRDREAFRAPYRTAPSRAAIADFVDDIPLRSDHPSEVALAEVAERLPTVQCPVLLAWGSKDPVFDDDFLADLAGRFPNTSVQRFPKANHLVMAEADVAGAAATWLDDLRAGRLAGSSNGADGTTSDTSTGTRAPLWAAIEARAGDDAEAFVDMATGDAVTFADFGRRVEGVAAELVRRGLRPGDRVAMLTPPGVDLVIAVYAVWRAGGVTVIADRGLGLAGLRRAVRGARPSWVIGPKRVLAVAATMSWAPRATRVDVADLRHPAPGPLPPAPGPSDPAAVLFTSGATGPAKGVRYLHRQLEAQRDALRSTYAITADDRLVAAFAPFALYGPALGITTALPASDVTRPAQLTASMLDDACARIDATMAFASPSALANVVATAGEAGGDRDGSAGGLAGLRLVLSAGAPVPSETLRAVTALAPDAALRTPYGMTEVLPVADIELADIDRAEADDPSGGVCVGRPVTGAAVRIAEMGFDPAVVPDPLPTGDTGEILVEAPWVSDGYLDLWALERQARPPAPVQDHHNGVTWHRSGDVGHLDGQGRLWVEGRLVHVIWASDGPITSVPVERTVERSLGLARSAAVGVGPRSRQQLVVVVEGAVAGLADDATAARVRDVVAHPVAAVLSLPSLPVDIRHNAKIDRAAVADWAEALLAGRRATPPS